MLQEAAKVLAYLLRSSLHDKVQMYQLLQETKPNWTRHSERSRYASRVTWFDRAELSFIFRQKDARQTRSSMPILLHLILPRLRQKRLKLFADHIMAKHRTRHLLVQGLHGQDFL